MIKTFQTVTVTQLNRNISTWVDKVENSNKVIYIIKNSKIVAKLEGVEFGDGGQV
jgi:antitoxin (DNA-binding transcriptional repressor) of toxin-antitoxin stability system